MDGNKNIIKTIKELYPFFEKAVFLIVAIVGLIVTIRLSPVFKSIDRLTNKINALEQTDVRQNQTNIDVGKFIQEQTKQTTENTVLLKMITGYFKLTPKD